MTPIIGIKKSSIVSRKITPGCSHGNPPKIKNLADSSNINIEDRISAFVKLDILLMYLNSIIGSTNILESKNPRRIKAVTDNAILTFP